MKLSVLFVHVLKIKRTMLMTITHYSPEAFDAVLQEHIRFFSQNALQLGEPVDMTQETYNAYIENVKVQSQINHSDCVFYMVVNHKTVDIEWLHQLDSTLGFTNDLSVAGFYKIIQPKYLKMYVLWACCATEFAATEMSPKIRPLSHAYHIELPLRRADGTHHWFHQQTVPLQFDAKGQLCSYLNTYNYVGEWTKYTLRPFMPHVTFNHAPKPDINARLIKHFSQFIQQFLTPTEIKIIKRYGEGLSVDNIALKDGWKRSTVLDYNKNILGKINDLFCYEFGTAQRASLFLTEKKLIV